MPGGKGKIQEYNESLTPEQRKSNARKAAQAPRRKVKTIREIAKIINAAPASNERARQMLFELGIDDEDMTNAALIAASVFRAAFEGDLKAVDKWERYTGQVQESRREKLENAILKQKLDEDKAPSDPVEIIIAPRGDNDEPA